MSKSIFSILINRVVILTAFCFAGTLASTSTNQAQETINGQGMEKADYSDWLEDTITKKYVSPWTSFNGNASNIEFKFTRKRDLGGLDFYHYYFRNTGPNQTTFTFKMPWQTAEGIMRVESGTLRIKPYSNAINLGHFFIGARGQELIPQLTIEQSRGIDEPENKSFSWFDSSPIDSLPTDSSGLIYIDWDEVRQPTIHFKSIRTLSDKVMLNFEYEGLAKGSITASVTFRTAGGGRVLGQASKTLLPNHVTGQFANVSIPYSIKSFNLPHGTHSIEYSVTMTQDRSNSVLGRSQAKSMTCSIKKLGPTATFESLKVTSRGMKADFRHSGFKNQQAQLVVHFSDKKKNIGYRTLSTSFTPKYDPGKYDDFLVRIPGRHFGTGYHDLNYYATIVLNGQVIARSSTQNMWWCTGQNLGTLRTKSTRVTIECRDHGIIDGDAVAIYRNGRVVKSLILLNSRNTYSHINLEKGNNVISFRALNEGTSSPNTAEFRVTDSNGQYLTSAKEWSVSAGKLARITVIRE